MSKIDKFKKGHYKEKVILYALALHWYIQYDDSNPDVGMGATDTMLLDDLIKQCKVPLTEEEQLAVLEVACDFDD